MSAESGSVPSDLSASLADRYRVKRELGRGGMATVYLAHDLKHDRDVAIKVLHEDLAATLGAERFLREITIAARLTHPHILPMLDSGDAGGMLFYVMPYVEGESLRNRLDREKQLAVDDALQISREVADALSYAHAHGVIHRDIKPENILLESGHAVVADFGIARAIDHAGGDKLTATGIALGTPAYMSPEQAAGSKDLDGRSDLYSLGCVLFEMLAGRPPFVGPTAGNMIHQHLTAEPPNIMAIRPAVPAQVAAALERALAKTPADRFNPVALFAEAIGARTSTAFPTPSAAGAAPLLIQRSWRRVALFSVAAVVLITVGAVWVARRNTKTLDMSRVLVVPFELKDAVPAASSLPAMFESSIVQGLQRTGLGTISDSRTAIAEVAFKDTAAAALANATTARRLAREAGAGLLVTGSMLVLGDSVRVEGKLLSTETGLEAIVVPAEAGPLAAASALSEAVTQRLMGALAMFRDPALGSALLGTRAPTYAAYRVYQRGNAHMERSEYSAAAEQYQRAFELDTTFLSAAVRKGYALWNAERRAAVDSLAHTLEPRRPALSPFETHYLDRLVAWNGGDLQAALVAARGMARAAPASNLARAAVALSALSMNRLTEARDALATIDVNSPDLPGVLAYYVNVTAVNHLLGDHASELQWAREWRSNPRSAAPLWARQSEIIALVALGKTAEVEAAFPEFLTARAEGGTSAIGYGLRVLRELRWHGADAAAQRLSRAVLVRRDSLTGPLTRVELLLYAGDVEQAAALADSTRRARPTSAAALMWSGILAARRNDLASATGALQNLELLKQPFDAGFTPWRRAQILAVMGNRDEAVRLLEHAHAGGLRFEPDRFYHAWFGLEPLRGFPPFEAFVKPK